MYEAKVISVKHLILVVVVHNIGSVTLLLKNVQASNFEIFRRNVKICVKYFSALFLKHNSDTTI